MSLLAELKRRNVIKVALAYLVLGWVAAQVAEFATENFGAPEWVLKTFVVFLIIGLPFVLIFAWAFEMTPEGIKREKDVDRSQSITSSTGKKLNRTIFVVMAIALSYFVWEARFQDNQSTSESNLVSPSAAVAPTTNLAQSTLSTVSGNTLASSDNSIAVLPFANRSKLEDDLYFTDGIHDDLLTQLAKISDLKVISRTSVMEYRDTTKKIPEIAAELGVSTILEGGIQRAGKRIRINAQLIDVSNDQHLWAETFDREMTVENIFDIQSEITRHIVKAVRGELTEEEAEAISQFPTDNLQAYEAYMRARAATQEPNYEIAKYLRAQEWAEKAVALDPGFAWAWSILVEAHGQSIWIGYDASPQRFAAAKTALENAMAKDPESAEAQTALGEYNYRIDTDYPRALKAFKQAAVSQPGNAAILVQLALTQRRMGLYDDAVESYEKALRLDPTNQYATSDYLRTLVTIDDWQNAPVLIDQAIDQFPGAANMKGHKANMLIRSKGDLKAANQSFDEMEAVTGDVYFSLATGLPLLDRDFDRAIAAWDLPEVVTYAGFSGSSLGIRDLSLGEIYLLMGDQELAFSHFRATVEIVSAAPRSAHRNDAFELINLAIAYAYLGENELAVKTSSTAVAIMAAGTDRFEGIQINQEHAKVLAITGHRDEALEILQIALGEPGSQTSKWEYYLDPRWDFFRDDERFNALVRPDNLEESGR